MGAQRQPAAREGRRYGQRGHRSAADGGRWDPVRAQPERPGRGVCGLARLVEGGRGCVRHVELVRGDGVRSPPHADSLGRPWRADAVRARDHGTDRGRGIARHRPRLRAGPGADRCGPRAAGAQRGRPHRALVDRARGAHRAAVKVYFHTFGCKANQYDTALVRQAFVDQGVVVVDDPDAADLAVVNSCTVTHESEAKLGRLVRRLARHGGHLETVVMGCAAALDDGRIANLPSVRAVVGGAEPARVLQAAGFAAPLTAASPPVPLSSRAASPPVPLSSRAASPPVPLSRSPHPLSPSPFGRGGTTGRFRGLLKIQDGCDEHCTFCATTIARGANRSRGIPELVAEATALAEQHAEIVLTGIHIGTYGQDRSTDPGRKPGEEPDLFPSGFSRARARGQSNLGDLLEALVSAVPSVRFRLSSIEATEVDDTIARLLIEAPAQLAAHLHAPLQSGANRILKRMGRHWYTAESYRARLEWLAERLPVFGLGADIIAGFPGERDAEHHETVALVEALPFTYLHVFPYSERPGAAAGRLGERVPPGAIRERARELRETGEVKARGYRARRQGQLLTEDYLSVYLPTDQWNGRPRFEVTVR